MPINQHSLICILAFRYQFVTQTIPPFASPVLQRNQKTINFAGFLMALSPTLVINHQNDGSHAIPDLSILPPSPTYPAIPPMSLYHPALLLLDIKHSSNNSSVCFVHGDSRPVFFHTPNTSSYILQDQYQQPVWSLTAQDWRTMVFGSAHNTIHLSISNLTFESHGHTYQWRVVPLSSQSNSSVRYDFRCYHVERQTLMAELTDDASRFVLWSIPPVRPVSSCGPVTNPFRSLPTQRLSMPTMTTASPVENILLDPLASFLVFSALLFYHQNIGIGAKNTENSEPKTNTAEEERGMEDDTSVDSYHYYAEQGLVDFPNSAMSVKSLELSPGWWGYGWKCCPCCMPGGWFDSMWINVRKSVFQCCGRPSRSHHRRQGWQQQSE
ncbi:hypothetical protein J3Q64DRAFT_1401074 [Phycomyces blakesleeanus]|uniref:Uncharacterized protein n=1 Tax=Phycomyces blakesleeanus TaxID=4837 RepID=A0ABR3B8B4_PHYBL